MKLQYRIILSVILGLTAVMLIFGYASAWALSRSSDADAQARLAIARAIASHLDGMIDDSMDDLTKTAELPTLTQADSPLAQKQEVLRDTQSRIGDFANLTLMDASGNLVVSAPDQPTWAGTNLFSTHLAAAAAFATGEPQRSEWHPLLDGDKPMACLSVPLRNQAGNIIGVLMAELDPEAPGLHFTLASRNVGALRVELVNESRVLTSSSDMYGLPRPNPHAALLAPFVREHRAGIVVHDLPGIPRHTVAYVPLESLPGWGVALEQPLYSTLEFIPDLQKQLFALGALALVIASGAAWVDTRRALKPLNTLALATDRIGTGDLASPIEEVHGADEVGALTQSVETMRQNLRDLIDKRQQYEAELEKRAEQRSGEVSTLLAASEAFASTLDVSALLQIILAESRRLCPNADAGMVIMFEPRLGSLTPVASFGCDLEALRGVRLAPGEGMAGKVFESGRPVFLTGDGLIESDQNLSALSRQRFEAAGLPAGRAHSALCVPLVAKSGLLGVLIVYDLKDPPGLAQSSVKVLQGIAYQAAVALENAQLYEEVQQKEELRGRLLTKVITAQEEERRRIARELHDEFAQSMTAMRMSLEAIEAGLPTMPAAQRERFQQAQSLTEQALANVRQMIADLRPTVLDDMGLGSAVRSYAQQRLEGEDIRVYVSAVGLRERFPAHVETEVYRVFQEAISNISKHAQATQVWIRLRYSGGWLMGSIEDNGCGFSVDKVKPSADGSQLGLLGMRERVELLGGSLKIRSLPGKGTRLMLRVPIGGEVSENES